jgi:hypothetical protein
LLAACAESAVLGSTIGGWLVDVRGGVSGDEEVSAKSETRDEGIGGGEPSAFCA